MWITSRITTFWNCIRPAHSGDKLRQHNIVTIPRTYFSFRVRLDLLLGLCRVPLRKCGLKFLVVNSNGTHGAWYYMKCQRCGAEGDDVVRYRQRTMYNDEESNWVELCPPCQKENDEYLDDMWADVYSNY